MLYHFRNLKITNGGTQYLNNIYISSIVFFCYERGFKSGALTSAGSFPAQLSLTSKPECRLPRQIAPEDDINYRPRVHSAPPRPQLTTTAPAGHPILSAARLIERGDAADNEVTFCADIMDTQPPVIKNCCIHP